MSIEDRIESAIDRITSGQGCMRVPPDETDPDLVLADCRAEIARLRAEVERLDDGETQAIKERDHAEKIIDKLCDAVLGAERAEWSSGYFFEDAVDDVEAAIYRLRAEADALRAGQKLVGYRWRHSAGEKWQFSDIPCGWEYEPLYAAMGADA